MRFTRVDDAPHVCHRRRPEDIRGFEFRSSASERERWAPARSRFEASDLLFLVEFHHSLGPQPRFSRSAVVSSGRRASLNLVASHLELQYSTLPCTIGEPTPSPNLPLRSPSGSTLGGGFHPPRWALFPRQANPRREPSGPLRCAGTFGPPAAVGSLRALRSCNGPQRNPPEKARGLAALSLDS